MANMYRTMGVIFWLHMYHTDGAAAPSLYSLTPYAVPGSPFTLVCTLNNTDNGKLHAMDITWIRGVDEQFVFDSKTCVLEKIDNGSVNKSAVTARFGYLYHSLTFTRISTSDITDVWYCSRSSKISNPVTIQKNKDREEYASNLSSQSDIVYSGSSINLTCTLVNGTLALATWIIQQAAYFRLGGSCKVDLQDESNSDERDIVNRSHTDCSQSSSQTVTINNVSLADHSISWQCTVGGKTSNVLKIIVLDPDLPSNVSILRKLDTEQDVNSRKLLCSSACENEFIFNWDIPGIISDTLYNSCKHVCSETLNINVNDSDHGKQIQCTVINTRTGKRRTAQYRIMTRDETITGNILQTTSGPGNGPSNSPKHKSGVPPYIWGAVVGGAIVIIIVIVVVIVVCRRRLSSNPSKADNANMPSEPNPVMGNNVLYESHPDIDDQENRESKMVMDNILYEPGGLDLNVENTKVASDDSSYEKCDITSHHEYYVLEQVAFADNSCHT